MEGRVERSTGEGRFDLAQIRDVTSPEICWRGAAAIEIAAGSTWAAPDEGIGARHQHRPKTPPSWCSLSLKRAFSVICL
jgi:hypothetical protein